jgi:hypothetical protein
MKGTDRSYRSKALKTIGLLPEKTIEQKGTTFGTKQSPGPSEADFNASNQGINIRISKASYHQRANGTFHRHLPLIGGAVAVAGRSAT